jgi:hypothetical protein
MKSVVAMEQIGLLYDTGFSNAYRQRYSEKSGIATDIWKEFDATQRWCVRLKVRLFRKNRQRQPCFTVNPIATVITQRTAHGKNCIHETLPPLRGKGLSCMTYLVPTSAEINAGPTGLPQPVTRS